MIKGGGGRKKKDRKGKVIDERKNRQSLTNSVVEY